MNWYYDRLVFALQNLTTFLFFDDKKSKQEIQNELNMDVLNFSTDPIFGRYAPVYYSAYNFLEDMYRESRKQRKIYKNTLYRTLYTFSP